MVRGPRQFNYGSVDVGQLDLLRRPEVQCGVPEPDQLGPGDREGGGQGRWEVHLQPGDLPQAVSDGLPSSGW